MPDLQAPEGTYDFLSDLQGSTLGNIMSKRLVWIKPSENIPERLDIVIRVKGLNPEDKTLHTIYSFGINDRDQIDSIEAKAEKPRERPYRGYNDRFANIETPPFEALMEHVRTAARIQPTLKYEPRFTRDQLASET